MSSTLSTRSASQWMCEEACCASLPSEMRFGGLLQAGVALQTAQHGTTPLYLCTPVPLYRALSHQSVLHGVSLLPSSGEGECTAGKVELHVVSLNWEHIMSGSI